MQAAPGQQGEAGGQEGPSGRSFGHLIEEQDVVDDEIDARDAAATTRQQAEAADVRRRGIGRALEHAEVAVGGGSGVWADEVPIDEDREGIGIEEPRDRIRSHVGDGAVAGEARVGVDVMPRLMRYWPLL